MKCVGVAQGQLFGAQFARLGRLGVSVFKVQKSSNKKELSNVENFLGILVFGRDGPYIFPSLSSSVVACGNLFGPINGVKSFSKI